MQTPMGSYYEKWKNKQRWEQKRNDSLLRFVCMFSRRCFQDAEKK